MEPAEITASSITKQPFGATEQQVSHEGHADAGAQLEEVEPFDLNDSMDSGVERDSLESHDGHESEDDSAISPLNGAPPKPGSSRHRRHSSTVSKDKQPPNPLEAEPGEDTTLPIRDYRLNMMHSDHEDMKLPKVPKGAHDGPDVTYGKDIVLDMEGFHGDDKEKLVKRRSLSPSKGGKGHESDGDIKPEEASAGLDARPSSPIVPNSPPWRPQPDSVTNEDVEALVDDLMASDGGDLPASMAALSLEGERPRSPPLLRPESPARSRFDRGASEPPDVQRPTSPTGAANEQMDYAWDWGKIPEGEEADVRPSAHRSESLPAAPADGAGLVPRARLHSVDEDPWTFALSLDGREHVFELSLCGDENFAPFGEATDDEVHEFVDARVSFERFMSDASIADDPRLTVFFDGKYFTWKTAYHLLFALSIYRRSLQNTERKQPEPKRQGYGWSRWWRRGTEEPAASEPAISRTTSAQAVLEKDKEPKPELEKKDDGELKSDTESEQQPDDGKHYAKTLRLSSDQLKQLNLKPGPNTIQFSVTSSYSGLAVVSARIFLWEDTDQIVISDIDGTITKWVSQLGLAGVEADRQVRRPRARLRRDRARLDAHRHRQPVHRHLQQRVQDHLPDGPRDRASRQHARVPEDDRAGGLPHARGTRDHESGPAHGQLASRSDPAQAGAVQDGVSARHPAALRPARQGRLLRRLREPHHRRHVVPLRRHRQRQDLHHRLDGHHQDGTPPVRA